jgi:hypothetical protein
MTAGPLVEPSPWAGVWIAEDIELITHGVRTGSWVDGTLGAVGAGLDGLAFVSDPVGALLQYGIAWLIEHVKPLSEALDWLAGDPAQITAHAQTWRNVSSSVASEADGLAYSIRSDVAEWSGSAAAAYRGWAGQREHSVRALGRASETMALITEAAGALIGTVRMMVRDAVATVVSRLIVYAAELVATAGLATPVVAGQVAALCAAWGARISRWLKGLLSSLRKLLTESGRLAGLISKIKNWLGSPADAPKTPSEPPKKIGGPKTFDPEDLRGSTPDEIRQRIQDDWAVRPSAQGGGSVYSDPQNRGRQIRVMPGYPPGSRPDPLTWGPYVEVSQNGRTNKLPLAGNPTLGGAE